MKFIVDAQLPKSLSDFLKHQGYDSIHTLELPNKNHTKDSYITQLAIEEGRILITKDTDFLESFLVKTEPKKLILVKTGNITNFQLIALFSANMEMIIAMISRSNLVEINRTEIAEHG